MAPITALEAIEMLRILGLSVRLDGAKLFVSPAELIDEDVAWLIRTHKAEIIAALQSNEPRWAWMVCFSTHSIETYHDPYKTHSEMAAIYPSAIRIAPLPECEFATDPNKTED